MTGMTSLNRFRQLSLGFFLRELLKTAVNPQYPSYQLQETEL